MARATWTGAVTCGLVSVPVKLYTARTERRVKFHQINSKTGNRVRQPKVDEVTREEVPFEDIVKGFDMGDDRVVVLTDEDLEKVEPEKTREIKISQFCKADEIPTLAIGRPYYLGPNTGGQKAYRLLADTMQADGVVAVGRMVMRSVEYLVCLRVLDDGTLSLEQLSYVDEINSTDGLGVETVSDISETEMTMARQLVEAMTQPLDFSSMHDEHRAAVMEMIEAKAAGVEPKAEPAPATESPGDLVDALTKSLNVVTGEQPAKAKLLR